MEIGKSVKYLVRDSVIGSIWGLASDSVRNSLISPEIDLAFHSIYDLIYELLIESSSNSLYNNIYGNR